MQKQTPAIFSLMIACAASSGACTELLLDGHDLRFEDEETSSGDGGSTGGTIVGPQCAQNLTTCGDSCVDLNSDSQNCGNCARSCAGAACVMGMCSTEHVVDNIGAPKSIAVDETHVYWAVGDSVQRAPKAGGQVETLMTGITSAGPIAADGAFVFCIDAANGALMRIKKNGAGKPKVIYQAGGDNLGAIALDAKDLYFTRTQEKGEIRRADKASDAAPVPFIGQQPNATHLALLDKNLV
ncbi:MAG: hypothetical protein IPK82_27195 [Polyangiaceae bacterium]|nr:hypothetical protein [Polyangiaceae bacterium]